MKHYPLDAWEAYIRGGIDKTQSVQMEEHLGICEVCLNEYTKALESCGKAFDAPPGLLDKIMAAAVPRQTRKNIAAKTRNYRSVLVRYVAAAIFALALWQSGLFVSFGQSIISGTARPQLSEKINEKIVPGFGDRMTLQVNYFFNSLSLKEKEWFHAN